MRWLEADLAANEDKSCTLAYMHHPRFSSGEEHGSTHYVKPLWDALYKAEADVVLSGHEHNYERFAPQNPKGRQIPSGASASSWWAPVAAKAPTPSWIP